MTAPVGRTPTVPYPFLIATQWSMHYTGASHLPEFQTAIQVTLSVEELPFQPERGVSRHSAARPMTLGCI